MADVTGLRKLFDAPDPQWANQSRCHGQLQHPWTDDIKPSSTRLIDMEAICKECPVRIQCADYALNSRGGAGVDGGFYAGVWLPWKSNTEGQYGREMRRLARIRLRQIIRHFTLFG